VDAFFIVCESANIHLPQPMFPNFNRCQSVTPTAKQIWRCKSAQIVSHGLKKPNPRTASKFYRRAHLDTARVCEASGWWRFSRCENQRRVQRRNECEINTRSARRPLLRGRSSRSARTSTIGGFTSCARFSPAV
jgi:hypothetical protein